MSDAVERIIAKINEDVELKLREFREETEAKIEKIKKEEYARWARERERIEHEGNREIEGIRSLIISRAHLEGKRELLEAREKVMNRVIANIKSNARNSSKYHDYLQRVVEDAKAVLGEEFVVVCIPEDKKVVEEIVSKVAPKARIEMGAVKHGGIIARSISGERSVDYSVDAMVERKINEIRRMIVDKLFEGDYA